ncbi:hypothetical protein BY458DRAFT_205046 [Sporodiniella umbellata]|nr:hypothetical protein BY458DRAFT_205046 [Sporodiniella umbellata]
MDWLINCVGSRLPDYVLPRAHEYLILGLSVLGNPFLGSNATQDLTVEQSSLIHVCDSLFNHLLNTHPSCVIESLTKIVKQYTDAILTPTPALTDVQKHTLGYLLSLTKISPNLLRDSWSSIFNLLYQNNTVGNIFYYEKTTASSIIKNGKRKTETITGIFSHWLTNTAFDAKGIIMSHPIDVMIILDTLVYDSRLHLAHLVPTGDKSILDTLQPSDKHLSLEPPSIDIMNWIECRSASNNQKIPLSLLQLVLINNNSLEYAIGLFVDLITKLSNASDLVVKLIPTAEPKWPGLFQQVLEIIFSKTIAIHIADTIQIEKILSNLAALYEDDQNKPGFEAFQTYIGLHSRQVLLIFINHPSITCRVMGYRVLNNSKFYQRIVASEQEALSKLLVDAWFRHLKGRYLTSQDISIADSQHSLIINCCQNTTLAKTILSIALEHILNGALEIFPIADANTAHQQSKLFDKINQKDKNHSSSFAKKPPRFITSVDFFANELNDRDRIYIENIERTATLFSQFKDTITSEQYSQVHHHLVSFLSAKWSPTPVSLTTYDDTLPKNIPHLCDITIGNAFKDHPALFLIFEKSIRVIQPAMTNDIVRSILVYFIAFWNMKDVTHVPTTLTYATQLEETIRMLSLLEPVLPNTLVNSRKVFSLLSSKDLGDMLYQIIWYYVRHSTLIPGIHKTEDKDLVDKCKENMLSICQHRLKVLEKTPSWHLALQQAIKFIS